MDRRDGLAEREPDMSGWLYLITAFGSRFSAGTIFGVLLMSGRSRTYSSPGCGQGSRRPARGRAPTRRGSRAKPEPKTRGARRAPPGGGGGRGAKSLRVPL